VTGKQKPARSSAFLIRSGRWINVLRNRIRGLGVGAGIGPGTEVELRGNEMVDVDLPVRTDDESEVAVDGLGASPSRRNQGERRTWSELDLPWHKKW
jgi:hypothetical protein